MFTPVRGQWVGLLPAIWASSVTLEDSFQPFPGRQIRFAGPNIHILFLVWSLKDHRSLPQEGREWLPYTVLSRGSGLECEVICVRGRASLPGIVEGRDPGKERSPSLASPSSSRAPAYPAAWWKSSSISKAFDTGSSVLDYLPQSRLVISSPNTSACPGWLSCVWSALR